MNTNGYFLISLDFELYGGGFMIKVIFRLMRKILMKFRPYYQGLLIFLMITMLNAHSLQ